ncbi:hypothetical protein HUK65_03755 [Rhodobacteraceae bacterium 2376]|uniref:Uncharacterized protein n=1 Tax=Rhabdonatronobacter sediminivivens TaxID=2743469 RepID=A0A7Z0KY12_9RHOB|nr:hypothetical protein [Rhabdonatronobacter sediminivivens]NYS24096.1 hypothetical protein [Rhabdonatronobacter sediminivivens]
MAPGFDPLSIWTRNTVVWVRYIQAQQEFWLRMMGVAAQGIPHQSSAELAAEAEAMCSEEAKKRKPKVRPTASRTSGAEKRLASAT